MQVRVLSMGSGYTSNYVKETVHLDPGLGGLHPKQLLIRQHQDPASFANPHAHKARY